MARLQETTGILGLRSSEQTPTSLLSRPHHFPAALRQPGKRNTKAPRFGESSVQAGRQTRIFICGFGPSVSMDQDRIFHQASLSKHHHTRRLQGLGAYRSPHFLVALEAAGAWAVKIPPEPTGNALGQEARGFSRAASAAGGQRGSRREMPGARPLPGTGCCSQMRGSGEGGLVPREFPLERVPICCIVFWTRKIMGHGEKR